MLSTDLGGNSVVGKIEDFSNRGNAEKGPSRGDISEQRNNTAGIRVEQRDQFSPFDEPDSLFDIRFVYPRIECEKNTDMLSPQSFQYASASGFLYTIFEGGNREAL